MSILLQTQTYLMFHVIRAMTPETHTQAAAMRDASALNLTEDTLQWGPVSADGKYQTTMPGCTYLTQGWAK